VAWPRLSWTKPPSLRACLDGGSLRRLHGGSRAEPKYRRRRDRELTARRSTLARSAHHDWTAGASDWRRESGRASARARLHCGAKNLRCVMLRSATVTAAGRRALRRSRGCSWLRSEQARSVFNVRPNVEVTGPERRGAWAARRNMDNERFAAQVPCRGGSG
jgi:hypothetical protein